MTAKQLNQSIIWYSACNEDASSEIAALEPAGKRILCITASGSRAFDLLLADPAEVISIDENPAQTALAELYSAAYLHYEYDDFCALLGLIDNGDRIALLDGLLPHICASAQFFWKANRHLAKNGLLYCGRWEGYMRKFMRWAGARRRKLATRLLNCATIDEQRSLWKSEWDDWQWRLFLRILAIRPLWRWVLDEPGIAFIPKDFDMTAYARAQFDHAAHNLHLRQLPFAWLLLKGSYHPDILPLYLTKEGHTLIRSRISRLKLHTASLQQTVAATEAQIFDAISLSDYSSYCDVAEQDKVWRNLARHLPTGGRVAERKFFNKTGMELPDNIGFKRQNSLEQQLNANDGAWFYTFVVAVKEA